MNDTETTPPGSTSSGSSDASYIGNITKSIALTETATNGLPNYTAIGDNGTAAGAYQWSNEVNGTPQKLSPGQIPANFASDATKFGLDPTDFSPTNQNNVAYAVINDMVTNKGYKPWEVGSAWNSGSPDNYQNHSGTDSSGLAYDTPAYVKRMQLNYQKVSGGGTVPTSTSNSQSGNSSNNSQIPNPLDPSTWGETPVQNDALTIAGGEKMVTPGNYALQEAQKTGALFGANAWQGGMSAGSQEQNAGMNILDTLKIIPNIASSAVKAAGGLVNSTLHPIQTAENIISDPLSLVPDAYKQIAGGVFSAGGDILNGNSQQAVGDFLSGLDKARISFVDDPVGTYLLGRGLTEGIAGAAEGAEGIYRDPTGTAVDENGKATTPIGKIKQTAQGAVNTVMDPGTAIVSGFKKISGVFKKSGVTGMLEGARNAVNSVTAQQKTIGDLQPLYGALQEGLDKNKDISSQLQMAKNLEEQGKTELDGFGNAATQATKDTVQPQSFANPKGLADTLVNFFNKTKEGTDQAYSEALRNPDGKGTPLTFKAKGDVIDAIKSAADEMDKESAGDPKVASMMSSMTDELRELSEKGKVDANNIQEFFKRWKRQLPEGQSTPTLDAFDTIRQAAYKAQEDTMTSVGKGGNISDLQKTRATYGKVVLSDTAKLVNNLKDDPEALLTSLTKPKAWADAVKTVHPQIIAHIQNSITNKILEDAKSTEDGTYNPTKIQQGINKYSAALKPDHQQIMQEDINALNLSKSIGKLATTPKEIIEEMSLVKKSTGLQSLVRNASMIAGKEVTAIDLGHAYMAQALDKVENDSNLTTDSGKLESLFAMIDKVGGKNKSTSIDIQNQVFGKPTMDMLNSLRDPKTGALNAFKEIENYKSKGIAGRAAHLLTAAIFATLHHGLIAAGYAAKALGPNADLPVANTFAGPGVGGMLKDAANVANTVTAPATQAGEAVQQEQPMEPVQQIQEDQGDTTNNQ